MANVAICLSGPKRFIEETLSNVEYVFGNFSFSIFIHTWIDETTRTQNWRQKILNNHPAVTVLLVEKGLDNRIADEDLNRISSGSNSPSYNTVSMFYGVLQCLRAVEESKGTFTHIARVRSDFMSTKSLKFLPDEGEIFTSTNPHIPFSWLSDHFMVGSYRDMLDLWSFKDEKEIVFEYLKNGRNPERLLSNRQKKARLKRRPVFRRFISYAILRFQEDQSDLDVMVEQKLGRLFSGFGSKTKMSTQLSMFLVLVYSVFSQSRHEIGFRLSGRRNL